MHIFTSTTSFVSLLYVTLRGLEWAVLRARADTLEANYTPLTGPFVPGVTFTPEFYPLVLTKNYGVKYVGIQYSVYFPGVTFTLFLEIHEYILSQFLLLCWLFAAASKNTRYYSIFRCNFYTGRQTSPVDCPRSYFLRRCP